VSEADGYQPPPIAPEQGYRCLVESSLILFYGPAEAVVDAVCLCPCADVVQNSLKSFLCLLGLALFLFFFLYLLICCQIEISITMLWGHSLNSMQVDYVQRGPNTYEYIDLVAA
jgi:hypothetical protein